MIAVLSEMRRAGGDEYPLKAGIPGCLEENMIYNGQFK